MRPHRIPNSSRHDHYDCEAGRRRFDPVARYNSRRAVDHLSSRGPVQWLFLRLVHFILVVNEVKEIENLMREVLSVLLTHAVQCGANVTLRTFRFLACKQFEYMLEVGANVFGKDFEIMFNV